MKKNVHSDYLQGNFDFLKFVNLTQLVRVYKVFVFYSFR